MAKIKQTVSYVLNGDAILLGMKKINLGKGLWNGFGGRVEEGESIEEAAAREVREESRLEPHSMRKCGVAFVARESSSTEIELHFFLVYGCQGEAYETKEMVPRWFLTQDIPYNQMWATDSRLIPLFLAGKILIARFHLSDPKTITDHKIREVSTLPELIDFERL